MCAAPQEADCMCFGHALKLAPLQWQCSQVKVRLAMGPHSGGLCCSDACAGAAAASTWGLSCHSSPRDFIRPVQNDPSSCFGPSLTWGRCFHERSCLPVLPLASDFPTGGTLSCCHGSLGKAVPALTQAFPAADCGCCFANSETFCSLATRPNRRRTKLSQAQAW